MIQLEIITEDKQLASICELYWEVDADLNFVHKVGDLAKLADSDRTKLPALIRENCNATINDWNCSNCGKPYIFSGRSDFSNNRRYLLDGSYRERPFLCVNCLEEKQKREIEQRKLQEEAARQVREAAEVEARKKIREIYNLSERQPIDIQSLSLADAIYLISIMRGGAIEDLTRIMPVAMFEQPLSADHEFSTEIISYLYDNRLIYVHPESVVEAFKKDDIGTFYIYRVDYAPPISKTSPNNPKALLIELHNLIDRGWAEEWCQEALQIWKKIALSECKEYLLYVLKEHNFEFSPGEKTTQHLEFALEHYSTGQVYNMIWRAAKDAAAYYLRGGVPRQQAANSAISAIQRYTERALAENWDLKPYRRNYKTPQAIVSEVFYNLALRLGEDGFLLVPNIQTIRAKRLTQGNQDENPPTSKVA
jgi:hypothetical protein